MEAPLENCAQLKGLTPFESNTQYGSNCRVGREHNGLIVSQPLPNYYQGFLVCVDDTSYRVESRRLSYKKTVENSN